MAPRGQLILFPLHMEQNRSHVWRFAGTNADGELIYRCSLCESVKKKRPDGSEVFGLATERDPEPVCKGAA